MTTNAQLLRCIRLKCIDCCGGSRKEVALCNSDDSCSLHPFRMGKDPNPSKNRGFAKQPADKVSFSRENDPPPKEETPANGAATPSRGSNEKLPQGNMKGVRNDEDNC